MHAGQGIVDVGTCNSGWSDTTLLFAWHLTVCSPCCGNLSPSACGETSLFARSFCHWKPGKGWRKSHGFTCHVRNPWYSPSTLIFEKPIDLHIWCFQYMCFFDHSFSSKALSSISAHVFGPFRYFRLTLPRDSIAIPKNSNSSVTSWPVFLAAARHPRHVACAGPLRRSVPGQVPRNGGWRSLEHRKPRPRMVVKMWRWQVDTQQSWRICCRKSVTKLPTPFKKERLGPSNRHFSGVYIKFQGYSISWDLLERYGSSV